MQEEKGSSEYDKTQSVEPKQPPTKDDISDWTGDLKPDEIEALHNVRDLEIIYPLLHSLIGHSPRDFLVRAAVMEELVASDRPAFSPDDFAEVLYWLDTEHRESILNLLRSNGWLEHIPGYGTIITDAGRWTCELLSFFHKKLSEGEFLSTVAGTEYALDIGADPIRHLQSMRSRLVALQGEIEFARRSHSEVILLQAAAKLNEVLRLSIQIRVVLDRISMDSTTTRKIIQDIHSLLSSLHGVGAELHSDITEVGRQHLKLTAGMTTEQIVRGLRRLPLSELADAGRNALLPSIPPIPLLTTEVLANAAEQHMLKERHEPVPLVWIEPPEPQKDAEQKDTPEEVLALIADLSSVATNKEAVPLSMFIPRKSPGESFLRASLVTLAGEKRAGEGIVARIGAIPVELEVENDGWPQPVEGQPLKGLSAGRIKSKEAG